MTPDMVSVTYSFPYIGVFLTLLVLALPLQAGGAATAHNGMERQLGVFVLLFFFIGLRGFIFSDWRSYHSFFEAAPTLFSGTDTIAQFVQTGIYSVWEKGFVFYSILIKTICGNYFFWQALSYAIDFFVLRWLFSTYAPGRICLCFAFFFVFGLTLQVNLMRNIKAVLLFIISLRFVESRKSVPFLLLNGAGCLFHISSIIFLPLYFILTKRLSPGILIALFLLGNVIYLAQIPWCLPVLNLLGSLMDNRLSGLIETYTASERWAGSYGLTIGYFERAGTFILMMMYRKKLCSDTSGNILFNCLILYLFSYLYLSEMKILSDRIPILFNFSYWLLYPKLYGFLPKTKKVLFLCVFCLYSCLKLLFGGKSVLYSYDNALLLRWNYEERVRTLTTYYSQYEVFGK